MESNGTLNLIFQIAGAVGSIATFGAFVFLFRRDKDKQTQIDKLTGITSILDAQNDTMKMHNDLVAQQVDIFRNTSILKGNDENALRELKEIEIKKLKLSVKPNLYVNGAGYSGFDGKLHIDLTNRGEDAKVLEINLNSGDIKLNSESLPFDFEKGQRRNLNGITNGKKHIKDSDYEIDIIYIDKLENKYLSKIEGKGGHAKIAATREIE